MKFVMENDHDQSEWISTIKTIMRKLDLSQYFEQTSVIFTDEFKKLRTDRLHKNF